MKIQFLGTAASECIPNPFCRCAYCTQVRVVKGKDLRSHSSAIIDDEILIDIAPEFTQQLLREGLDASALTDLLITHTHPDHFNVGELYSRMEGYGFHLAHPLSVMGNDRAVSSCIAVLPGYSAERFSFTCLIPFATVERRGYKITPLLANHARWEMCFVYVIEKDGVRIFYGHDSGWYPEPTWQWLAGKTLDLVVLECTYGNKAGAFTDNHMNLATVFAAQQKLNELGCLHKNSRIVISHLSHTGGLFHQDLVGVCQQKNITVAFDGLVLTISPQGDRYESA